MTPLEIIFASVFGEITLGVFIGRKVYGHVLFDQARKHLRDNAPNHRDHETAVAHAIFWGTLWPLALLLIYGLGVWKVSGKLPAVGEERPAARHRKAQAEADRVARIQRAFEEKERYALSEGYLDESGHGRI